MTGKLYPFRSVMCRGTGILAPWWSSPAPGRPKPVPGRRDRRPRAVTGPGAQGLRRDPAYGLRLRVQCAVISGALSNSAHLENGALNSATKIAQLPPQPFQ